MSSICSPLPEQLRTSPPGERRSIGLVLIPASIWTINILVVFLAIPFLVVGRLRRLRRT